MVTKRLTEAYVAGVDGCHAGWICAIAEAGNNALRACSVYVTDSFKDLIEATKTCAAVSVDMPIGLSRDGLRSADTEARRMIGPRRSSVFPAPPRALLAAEGDYRMLNVLAKSIRAGISQQTYNLLPKIREVDAAITPALQARIRESHPEVSFCALNGDCLADAKRTAPGQRTRLALLEGVFGAPVAGMRPPHGAAQDDLYDALVLAWTASRIARGEARTLPAHPDTDERGLRMEIVY